MRTRIDGIESQTRVKRRRGGAQGLWRSPRYLRRLMAMEDGTISGLWGPKTSVGLRSCATLHSDTGANSVARSK